MSHFLNCQECVDFLLDYLDGNLDPGTAVAFSEHLRDCPPCVNFVESYRKGTEMSGQLADRAVDVPPELAQRLKTFLGENL